MIYPAQIIYAITFHSLKSILKFELNISLKDEIISLKLSYDPILLTIHFLIIETTDKLRFWGKYSNFFFYSHLFTKKYKLNYRKNFHLYFFVNYVVSILLRTFFRTYKAKVFYNTKSS